MLVQYTFSLQPERPCRVTPELGYRFYSALLEQLPEEFGIRLHQNKINPISQHFTADRAGRPQWRLTLSGEWYVNAAAPLLDSVDAFYIKHGVSRWDILERQVRCYDSVEELLAAAEYAGKSWTLRFVTPTAFKRQGQITCLPEIRLIVQNLVRKWNACFPECPIEDTDGEGVNALAQGLQCVDFQLQTASFRLKGSALRGFTGSLTLLNHLTGFHGQLANALLLFAECAGVGVKTTLGMGGVELVL
ncbi:MAG: CRISPR system precrRNA processing endoribonuclease RAMP protein Cas6 [Clostridiales bacterium]|nr:CRISPR system precrRNA processing endoribonuclease RAMP protein Cas6 [Clostridiales bacterium]